MEESPHKCPVCNRSFNQRSNLKTHLLTHTERPLESMSCPPYYPSYTEVKPTEIQHCEVSTMVQLSLRDREPDSTLLDLSSKRFSSNSTSSPNTIVATTNSSQSISESPKPKKTLGFSIEDIMKR